MSVLMNNEEVLEQSKVTNQLAEDISKCADYKPWHVNWITRTNGVIQAWEPDNTCIYTGDNLNDACVALNNSKFGS